MSEAEGALICQNVAPPAEGVTKLVALEDTLVWTASGSSSLQLQHWRMPSHRAQTRAPAMSRLTYLRRQLHTHRHAMQTRAAEGETMWFRLPYNRLMHLALPLSNPFTPFSPVDCGPGAGADVDVATLYSAASVEGGRYSRVWYHQSFPK
ncbi:hypothetical protein BC826DRAFT_1131346 [Russula brevipes]|nr:hypothetical protein BC826DRAFT_1131346 [Russula brevipes]